MLLMSSHDKAGCLLHAAKAPTLLCQAAHKRTWCHRSLQRLHLRAGNTLAPLLVHAHALGRVHVSMVVRRWQALLAQICGKRL